jgi:hypothetical protein
MLAGACRNRTYQSPCDDLSDFEDRASHQTRTLPRQLKALFYLDFRKVLLSSGRPICLAAALCCAVGCAGPRSRSGASPGLSATLVTPTAAVPWGRFLALDYKQPGQPKLTASEVALIHKALELVKPCQQQRLKYSFDNADPTGNTIDLYFEPSDPRQETAAIFWTGDYYYVDQGRAVPLPQSSAPIPGVSKPLADYPCHP